MTIFSWFKADYKRFLRPYALLVLGTFLTTSILSGALFVGDSVRQSLMAFAEKKIGNTWSILSSTDGPFLASLETRLEGQGVKTSAVLETTAIQVLGPLGTSVSQVTIMGVDSSYSRIFPEENWHFTEDNSVMVSNRLAGLLNLRVGDTIRIQVRLDSGLGGDNPFSPTKGDTQTRSFQVTYILPPEGAGTFSRRITQESPNLVYLSRKVLGQLTGQEDRATHLLIPQVLNEKEFFKKNLASSLIPEDFGISITTRDNFTILHSRKLFFPTPTQKILHQAFPAAIPLFGYFLTGIQNGGRSVPFVFVHSQIEETLTGSQVVLSPDLAQQLQVTLGDVLELSYFSPENTVPLPQKTVKAIYRGSQSLESLASYKDLLPHFPGLSGAPSCRDWNPGLPIDLNQVKPEDETFWNLWGPTPRVLVSYEFAKNLWGSTYGNTTGFILPDTGNNLALTQAFQSKLDPELLGFSLQNIREESLESAANGVDFGSLFLGLSFFLIACVLILTNQLYSLFILSRQEEIGTLSALGFSPRKVKIFFLQEALVPLILGLIFGFAGALGFNYLVLEALKSPWSSTVGTQSLQVHATWNSLIIGLLGTFFLTLFCVERGLNHFLKASPGLNQKKISGGKSNPLKMKVSLMVLGLILLSLVLVNPENLGIGKVASFFLCGIGTLGLFVFIFHTLASWPKKTAPLKALSFRNWMLAKWGHNKKQNTGLVVVYSLSLFLILTLSVFEIPESENTPGSGGYSYWAEISTPVPGEIIKNLPPHLAFSRRDGDLADCLNLNQVERPALLGISGMLMNKNFTLVNSLEPPGETPWALLEKSWGTNIIPAFADEGVITWSLKKKIGDTITYKADNGQEVKILLVGALASSIFQGYLIISSHAMETYFPSSLGTRLVVLRTEDPSPEDTSWYRILRTFGLFGQTTQNRMALFHGVENTYLRIFGSLGFLALLLGTCGFGLLILIHGYQQRSEWALLYCLGFSNTKISIFQAADKILLLSFAVLIGGISSFIALSSQNDLILYWEKALWPLLITYVSGAGWIGLSSYNLLKYQQKEVQVLKED